MFLLKHGLGANFPKFASIQRGRHREVCSKPASRGELDFILYRQDHNNSSQYSITEVWSVPYVGTVVNGILNAGSVKAGDSVLLGPDANGNYQTTVIKSMQRKR